MPPYSDEKLARIANNSPESAISVSKLSKIYAGGHAALTDIDLEIRKGEIFALLGPNGAGKTTLISIICGIVNPTSGRITAGGDDVIRDYRKTRAKIGLVPQELTTDAFETVWNTVSFSRGLFGKKPDPTFIERTLRDLSLWGRKDSKIITLSGGMKRRVLIAKALSHEPEILFLDEPTAGVDVELRRGMWDMVRKLQKTGVTIILTTHYIEEAEEMADRIGVINGGRIVLVEDKATRWSSPLIPRPNGPEQHGCWAISTCSKSGSRISIHDRGRWRIFSSAWSGNRHEPAHEFSGPARDLSVRNGAHLAHAVPERGVACRHHDALLHRVRRGDRIAYHGD